MTYVRWFKQDLATAVPDHGSSGAAAEASSSAVAAQRTLAVVQRFVALQQIHMVR